MIGFNVIVSLISAIIVGLIALLVHTKISTKRSLRVLRRQLTGLLSEVRDGMIISSDEKAKGIMVKRLERIVDMFDITLAFIKKPADV